MAEKYGMLPSEILSKATTLDMLIFNTSNIIMLREQSKGRGEDINHTYDSKELEELYFNATGKTKDGEE
tara:strand:+ start:149 stop:355 length:207 start_codon:yes stop_codon:yes gene_type:complete